MNINQLNATFATRPLHCPKCDEPGTYQNALEDLNQVISVSVNHECEACNISWRVHYSITAATVFKSGNETE